MRWTHAALTVAAFLALQGCGALSSLSRAGEELDVYTLSPAVAETQPSGGKGHLIVELPTSAGALATDRILIKPRPYQAQYLPEGRWSETTPALVQTLLVSSFQNLGGFRLVGRTANGLDPDYTLMSEVQHFQAEPLSIIPPQSIVRIGLMSTIIRESDRRIIATQMFSTAVTVASDDTADLVAAFDAATGNLLPDIVEWTVSQTR